MLCCSSPGVTLQDMVISNCNGSAIKISSTQPGGAPVRLSRVTLVNNHGRQGVAVSVQQGASLLMQDCLIANNSVTGAAGSVVAAASGTIVKLTRSIFDGNRATGVWTLGSNLTIDNCVFTDNTAPAGGGALHAESPTGGGAVTPCWVTVNSSSFSRNAATTGGGGAIQLGNGARLTLSLVTMANNTAPAGGAVRGLRGSCLVAAKMSNFTGEISSLSNCVSAELSMLLTILGGSRMVRLWAARFTRSCCA